MSLLCLLAATALALPGAKKVARLQPDPVPRFAAALARDSLVGLYRFESESSPGHDDSASAFHLVPQGGGGVSVDLDLGNVAKGLGSLRVQDRSFLGAAEAGAFPARFPVGDDSYTIALWAKLDSVDDGQLPGFLGFGQFHEK